MRWSFYTVYFITIISTVSPQLTQTENYDYCDPALNLCDSVTDHTMCKFPDSGLASRCSPNVQEELSSTEKKRILFWHNKFRSNVATGSEKNKNRKLPTASNMRQMYWDKELESIAERWANQCLSTTDRNIYDTCRNTKRFQVSQNVGTRKVNGSTIDKQAPQIIITWYRESKHLDASLIDEFSPSDSDKVAKQFANIIWANTYAIGCARVIFQETLLSHEPPSKNTTLWTIERLVCDYGPGGNQVGKSIYKRGTPCEDCPEGTHCSLTFPGLCAFQTDEKLESNSGILETGAAKEAETFTQILQTSEITESTPNQIVTTDEVESQDGDKDLNSSSETTVEAKSTEGKCTKEGEECNREEEEEEEEGVIDNEVTPHDRKSRIDEILKKWPKSTADSNSQDKEGSVGSDVGRENRVFRDVSKNATRSVGNGQPCRCLEVIKDRSSVLAGNHVLLVSVVSSVLFLPFELQ